ncbi:uncharacterized protein LOC106460375 [Limulus polyphemus]|uniref:Uncharacterized protein LOC106460375 n=1 Tax=Limulus polyphemus TaxID=6850 RepID=A0ABM1B605_LIMPO|nr:uncharacterized protein LOC106460375 [Limulus polyphemus]
MMKNYEVNVVTPLIFTKAVLPLLKAAATQNDTKPFGCSRALVVNISSVLGSILSNDSGGLYPYRASKAALNMISKSLAVDLYSDGILSVSIHPGWVKTDLGGPNALIDTSTSVEGILGTILKVKENDNGLLINYDGKVIPW